MGGKAKPNRPKVTLSDTRLAALMLYAEQQGSPLATEATMLLSQKIDEMMESGKIPTPIEIEGCTSVEEAEAIILAAQSKDRLIGSLLSGQNETRNGDLVIIGDSLGIPVSDLQELIEKSCYDAENNKDAKTRK